MPYYTTYKYRIYPNQEQEERLNATFGCCRFLFNQMLDDKIHHYEQNDTIIEYPIGAYKSEYRFLYRVDALALHRAKDELDRSFAALAPTGKFPSYKRKKSKQSCVFPNASRRITFSEDKRRIALPSVGAVRIHVHRPLPTQGKLISTTATREPSGKFFVALLFAIPSGMKPQISIIEETTVGLDYSAPHFYVDSNGNKATPPRFYKAQEKRMRQARKKLHRMTHGSKRYAKQSKKLARLHEQIANQRRNYLHQESHRIANEWDTVCVERLNMRSLSSTLHLGKSTQENSFGAFRVMLQYKLERQGKHLLFANEWLKTSQLCHVCGYCKKDLTLSTREWTCPDCHTRHDRDINAAINIKDMVLKYY